MLAALQLHTPDALKRRKLDELFTATADAFSCTAPSLDGLSYDERLLAYAHFTREQVERAIRRDQDLGAIQRRLYANAFQLGSELRALLGVRTFAEAMATARLLYRAIGIDFQADRSGEVVISRCLFSAVYSSQVCRLISALDSGVVAGLVGGGRLTFSQRITDGFDCCRATFQEEAYP